MSHVLLMPYTGSSASWTPLPLALAPSAPALQLAMLLLGQIPRPGPCPACRGVTPLRRQVPQQQMTLPLLHLALNAWILS